jgi:hypothetical protein
VAAWVQPADWCTLGGKRCLAEPEAWCCLPGSARLREAAVAEPRLLLRASVGRVALGNSGGRVRWPSRERHAPRSQLQVQSQRKADARSASRNGSELDTRRRSFRHQRGSGARLVEALPWRYDELVEARRHRFIAWGRSRLPDAEKERLNVATAAASQRPGWRGLLDRLRGDWDRLW